ncbi:GRPL2 protein, partial [Psilopogon haemacephalus]|nr:GRPL2 protein [Psilopogon haemacephalus]
MRRWLVSLWAVWAALRAAGGQETSLPSIRNKIFIRDCVQVHNDLRSQVQPTASNMRYMTWDIALSRTARAWAKKCRPDHNIYLHEHHQCHPNFTSIGENIWAGNHRAFTVATAVQAWYNEVKSYNFATQTCTKDCSHYTQVVWDHSYKIGCAVTYCKEVAGIPNAANFVCNYSPSGNLPRQPYIEGKPCNNCGIGDTCENNLCINVVFLCSLTDYPGWYPPWDVDSGCDVACIILIVVRVLLLILSPLAAHFIKACCSA